MEQRVFHSRVDALRREVMQACDLDLLIAYSDDILSAGAVRYLTDFDMYAMYGLAVVPRRGDVVLAFGLHHSAYLIRVKQAAVADHYDGTYHPGALCAELLAETQPGAKPRVGMVDGAHMFNSISTDIRSKMSGASFVDVDREFWSHYFASVGANGAEPDLRRSAVIATEAVAKVQQAFESGQRVAAHIAADAALAARRLGADIMNRDLVRVLCASGKPLPAVLSPALRALPEADAAFAIEVTLPYAGQRTVCGRTLLCAGANAGAAGELSRAAMVHANIIALLRVGATGGQIAGEARRLTRAAGFDCPEAAGVGNGIGLDLQQAPHLVSGDPTSLAAGMAVAVQTRLKGEHLGTIHQTDTVLIADAGPDILTVREGATRMTRR
jgi:hypothetical protein